MIGLTWGDAALNLTPLQWGALVGNCAAWLTQWRYRLDRRIVALLTCVLLFWAFRNVPLGRDTTILFHAAQEIHDLHLTFADFIGITHKYAYLEYQTPFYPFLVSRFPHVWQHQLVLLPCALAAIWCLFLLFGTHAALLCATPLWALMIQQPSTDIWLFFGLLVSLRLVQMGQRFAGAVVYGLTWAMKPLTILPLPFFIQIFGRWALVSVGMWAGYVLLSIHFMQGMHQFLFLLHQLFIRQQAGFGKPSAMWQVGSLRWRLLTVTRPALLALPVYLFPAWLTRWRWWTYVLLLAILGGYGNIKYQLLTLLFVLPLQTDGVP
jgi:hypothetical protein